jgi:hypothetical protein
MTDPADRSDDAGVVAHVQVVRGAPDDAELAALVAGLAAAAAAGDDEDPAAPTAAWMDRSRTMRRPGPGVLSRGDSAWRHSLR